jgi:xanthine dehydrogenase molybdenum-binding subunit
MEIGGCRLILNQDGSIKMMVGATEIGQGADTVFSQMVADTVGIPYEWVIADAVTDTDIAPFDTGAYASRQTFVSGMAVKKAAVELKAKILQASFDFSKIGNKVPIEDMDIVDGNIIQKHNGQILETLGDLALKTYYDLHSGSCLTADVSNRCIKNAYPYGVTLTEVEVDKKTGKVEVLSILNVHDSGKIINPIMATGQVEGGLAQGLGYGLAEELKYDEKTGKPLNNNLLDYKMPTFMDVPDLGVSFVEIDDPVGPYGNKSLGEPPLCSPAPALRNAIIDALGIYVKDIPVTPQKIIEALSENREV